MRAVSCELRTANCELRTANCELRTTAEELDLGHLKFSSGQVGRDALQALSMRSEASESPLQGRFKQLERAAGIHDLLPSPGQGQEEIDPAARALAAGTLRVLRKEASGWDHVSDAVAMIMGIENQFPRGASSNFEAFVLTSD